MIAVLKRVLVGAVATLAVALGCVAAPAAIPARADALDDWEEDFFREGTVRILLIDPFDSLWSEYRQEPGTQFELGFAEREGYRFLGWRAEDGTLLGSSSLTTIPDHSTMYVAQWEALDGSPTYPVTLDVVGEGRVLVSVEEAYEGSWVKVWTFPEDGGRVVSVDAVDASGNEPPYFSSFPSDSADGTEKIEDQWDFMMPPRPVHVTVTFGCDGGESCPSAGFSDVGLDAWYHEAVDWVVSNGVMRGYGDGSSFGPDGKITRAEMAQTLWNRAGRPSADLGAVASFADVSADAWYAEPIAWCVEQGIFGGYGDDFGVSRVISREETATVLWRVAGQPSASGSLGGFVDGGSVSSYAVEPMSWAVSAGVLTGKGGVALDPQGQCTRGEVAAMMMRMAQ